MFKKINLSCESSFQVVLVSLIKLLMRRKVNKMSKNITVGLKLVRMIINFFLFFIPLKKFFEKKILVILIHITGCLYFTMKHFQLIINILYPLLFLFHVPAFFVSVFMQIFYLKILPYFSSLCFDYCSVELLLLILMFKILLLLLSYDLN